MVRRRASGVEGLVVATQGGRERRQLLGRPVGELLVEPLATMVGHVGETAYGVVAGRDQAGATVVRVGGAHAQPELAQVLDLTAHRALVDVEVLDHRRRPDRSLVREPRQHQVGGRLEVLVDGAGAFADHPLDPSDQDRHLTLELAQGVRAGGQRTAGSGSVLGTGSLCSIAGSASSSVVRSGTSRMKSTQTSASRANGVATRNRWPVASPKAVSYSARTGAGRASRSGIEPVLWPAGMPSAASPSLTFWVTWWLSTAPRAETPIDPPIERKNDTTELAAPMSAWAVLFWTARIRFCMVAPRPSPSTAMNAPTSSSGVVASMVLSRAGPTTTSTMPPS